MRLSTSSFWFMRFSLSLSTAIITMVSAQQVPDGFADESTVSLWLFDEPQYLRMTLTDAGMNLYDLRLLDNGRMVPGKFGNALRTSSVAGPAVAYPCQSRAYDDLGYRTPDSWNIKPPAQLINTIGLNTWTFEFWLKLEQLPESGGTLIEFGLPHQPDFHCGLASGALAFIIEGKGLAGRFEFPTDSAAILDGQWHHIVFVRSNEKEYFHFVDGHRQKNPNLASEDSSQSEGTLQPGLVGAVFEGHTVSPLGLENAVCVKACGPIDFHWSGTRDLSWTERWRGVVIAPADGAVEYWVEAHDGVRLWIDGKLVIDGWENPHNRSARIEMHKGSPLPIILEFRQTGGTRRCRLHWRIPGSDWQLIPGEAFKHSVQDEVDVMTETKNIANDRFYFALGSGWLFDMPLDAELDEMRFSNIARYDQDFIPVSHSLIQWPQAPSPSLANGPPLLFDQNQGIDPVQLGSRKHVFIDDVLLDSRGHVQLRMIPPQMDEATDMRNDRIWESRDPGSFGDCSFYDDDGIIRFMYNNATMWRGNEEDTVLCMATSQDGLHFEKPEFSHVLWQGAATNNIVLRRPLQGRFFKDTNPATAPWERYKFGGFMMHRGVFLFTSPDGIHWRRNETILAPFDVGGGVEPYWDDQRGTYVCFIRNEGWTDWHEPFGRAVSRTETNEPFKPWPFKPALQPSILAKAWSLPSITTELPTPFQPKDLWHERPDYFFRQGQVYRSRARKYEWAPDTYISFHWRLYGIPDKEQRQSELAVSRDGVNWTFYPEPYLPFGVEYAGAKVVESLAMDGLVRRGDELWQYAELRFAGHRGGQFNDDSTKDVMMRYKQRLDGFVALEPRGGAGWVVTRPFVFNGRRLELNVAAAGVARVAILDSIGAVVPGYSIEECDLIQSDSVRHVVSWDGSDDVSRLAGRPVRLRFELENSRLFAFQFTGN